MDVADPDTGRDRATWTVMDHCDRHTVGSTELASHASPQRTVAGTVRVVDQMDLRLLGTGPTGVDPGVPRHRIRLLVLAEALVLGYQTPRARLLLVTAPDQLVLVVVRLGVRIDVRHLLGKKLIQGLPSPRFSRCCAEPVRTRPPIRRGHARVERIRDEI